MQLKGLKKMFRGGGTTANFVQQGAGRGRFVSARRRKERPEGVSLGAAPSRFFSKRRGRAGTARAMKSSDNKPRRVPKPGQNHPREVKNQPKRVPKPSENLPNPFPPLSRTLSCNHQTLQKLPNLPSTSRKASKTNPKTFLNLTKSPKTSQNL